MINIKEIKYEIQKAEYNYDKDAYDWTSQDFLAWHGLSELNSVPSLFIEIDSIQVAISLADLKTLLNLPAAQLLDTDMSKTTQG